MFLIVVLGACQGGNQAQDTDRLLHLSSEASTAVTQQVSHDIEEWLKKNPEIKAVEAVNGEKEMVLAYDVHHEKRFQMSEIESKLKKQLSEKKSSLEVTMSSDKKILSEVMELKKDMVKKNLTKKEINHRVKKIISLSYETA
ncbi:hypothetical protein [Aureibacillus halotolerans]|nr:hypothetical protein [Aureibacillus halotolerans]